MAERTVKVIEPTIGIINKSRKQRAAAYCRVSTDSEDQANSFSAQLKYYTEYIKSNPNMEFVDIYADEGITGTCVNKRDEFKRMMHDAYLGKIDRVFVKSVSRFARNSLECLEAIRKLLSYGVTVLFENDHIDTETMNSELILYVKSAFAQSEALAGAKRVSTAIRMKMETGEFITCTAPFGYTLKNGRQLEIVPDEAEIVRKIFAMYLSGIGAPKIATILNGSIESNKSKWTATGIQYILSNEKYVGDSLLQKTYTPQIFPLRNQPNKGELDKFYVKNSHQPIISREVFEATNQRLHRNKEKQNINQNNHLFTGMIVCKKCGWAYKRKVQNGTTYWVCSGSYCDSRNIKEEDIKRLFVFMYNKLRFFEKEIIDKTLNQLLMVRDKLSGQNNEISQIDIDVANLSDKNNMYTELHGKGIIDEVTYLERTSELKFKISELRSKRLKLLANNDEQLIIDEIRAVKDILSESPISILEFDYYLFSSIIEKVIMSNTDVVTFKLKGGIMLDVNLSEVF